MPILLPILLDFQGSAHLFGVGSFSKEKVTLLDIYSLCEDITC